MYELGHVLNTMIAGYHVWGPTKPRSGFSTNGTPVHAVVLGHRNKCLIIMHLYCHFVGVRINDNARRFQTPLMQENDFPFLFHSLSSQKYKFDTTGHFRRTCIGTLKVGMTSTDSENSILQIYTKHHRLATVLKTIFHQCVISYTCSQSNSKTEPSDLDWLQVYGMTH